MPHLIIEHSKNIQKNSIKFLEQEIQNIMQISEGNFSADECKCRSYSFDEYFVGRSDQSNASFIHITLKALTGRPVEIRKNLAEKIAQFTKTFITNLNLPTNRCDISVDIVEMERATYQKTQIEINKG